MNKGKFIHILSAVLLFAALVLAGISFLSSPAGNGNATLARRMGRSLDRRIDRLEKLSQNPSSEKLSEDMVVYRYENDSLVAWYNQFPLYRDDLTSRVAVQRLSGLHGRIVSPLADLDEHYSFVNFGPKWYIARCQTLGALKTVLGLEVANELSDEGYTVKPLSESLGVPVYVHGEPMFNVSATASGEAAGRASPLLFLAALFALAAAILWLRSHPTPIWLAATMAVVTAVIFGMYLYGRTLSGSVRIFSPLLYADGAFLYSLGALLLINLLVTLLVLCVSFVAGSKKTPLRISLCAVAILLIAAYIHLSFKSLVMNSGISVEVFKIATLSVHTLLVYVSYFLLSLTIPLIVRMCFPEVITLHGRVIFAFAAALYFVTASSVLGFQKERNRVEVWGNRLAMDRDIALELQLRSIDSALQEDPRLALMSAQPGSNLKIEDNLKETYMGRLSQGNDISVYLLGDQNSRGVEAIFDRRVRRGTPISDDSHFFYSRDNNGRSRYTGFFTYYVEGYGSTGLMICVESKANREDRGYFTLLGVSEPGRVNLPQIYSYAKYVNDRLVTFKGNYAYPTLVSDNVRSQMERNAGGSLKLGGFVHFIREIPGDEMIVVSRPVIDWLNYLVEGVLFALVLYVMLTLVWFTPSRRYRPEKAYFRRRINWVLFSSLLVTMIGMSVFSVYFVYRRSEAARRDILSSRINTIQSVMLGRCRNAVDFRDLLTQEIHSAMENVSGSLKADLTLYTPSGKALMTTTPEIFDRMIIGTRIDMDVLSDIVVRHKRFVISPERIGSKRYYALYAPLTNGDGEMVAIIGSPYTNDDYEMENEAVSHIATILVVFLLLLILARLISSRLVDRLVRPLSEMSDKMEAADVTHLEHIEYDRDDEVSSLVNAYNQMVDVLSDSTKKLAEAERDNAWAAMARQVAHEIKNPLTPMQLQIQMLVRQKATGNPAWIEKFDEASKIILSHIQILSDTANEFSNYAKLGMEKAVEIPIDQLLSEEVDMYASRDDIEFTYIGLAGAVITGPKPQLTRCIVNLLTNAVQAVDQRRASEGDGWKGRIMVSLRNSIKDGYYDIVFEDNGPGVREEHISHLFTPNFTTKSGGSGLGLAITRSIVEYCKGTVSYSRSFTLGGACFTIRYPK